MKVHFIAVGGAAMHNLALALLEKKYSITGSDDEIFEPSKSRLEKAGILPKEFGWFADKISRELDAVIIGMHARADNPELIRAKELGIKIFSYPEYLYEQTKNKTRVVIAGSHGKTTVTSMVMHVLKSAGINFDYMVGAQIEGFDTMVSLKEETKIAVFEGDEYLTSPIDLRPKFHLYQPNIALINGIAWDHINVFPTFETYCEQFRIFTELVEKNGEVIYFSGDEDILKVIKQLKRADITKTPFGEHPYKQNSDSTLLIIPQGRDLSINVFGKHNMQNIAGAKAVCNSLGLSDEEFYKGISTFKGSAKRLQPMYEDENVVAFLDFAHAPSKVKATVNAVREKYPERFLISFLELHTFSSLTKNFLKEYKNSLKGSDLPIVYYNPEVINHKKLAPVTKKDIEDAFSENGLIVLDNIEELEKTLAQASTKNPLAALFMSSGNIGGISKDELIKFVRN
jgi:UDP-N-acetylmuramate: L-alanyl-gamma-D-glutamyl-meso-diaminopimelate ligase